MLVPVQLMKESALSSTSDGDQLEFAELFLSTLADGHELLEPRENQVSLLFSAYRWLWTDLPHRDRADSSFFIAISRLISAEPPSGSYRAGLSRLSVTHNGNASFIPPPPEFIEKCMEEFDRFCADKPRPTPFLVKAALAQAQLEMIQPFEVGNSRIARMTMLVALRESRTLSEPLFCPSYAFSINPRAYFEALNGIRNFGEWEEWLSYFAQSVKLSADHSFESVCRLVELVRRDADSVIALGRPAESALKIFFAMVSQPVATSNWLVERTGLTPATVNKSLVHLGDCGIVSEITSRKRNRIFCYRPLIDEACRGTNLRATKLD